MTEAVVVIDKPTTAHSGQWQKGVSGNPRGRPPTVRDAVIEAKHALERFIRNKVDPEKAAKAVVTMVEKAAEGDVKAAAVIFPYLLSKPTGMEETGDKNTGGITIRIENATVKAQRDAVTDGEFKEIIHERQDSNAVQS